MITTVLAELTAHDIGCYFKENPAASTRWVAISTEQKGAKGRSYRGLVSNSQSGRECMNWLTVHKVQGGSNFIANPTDDQQKGDITVWGNGIGNHKYCRNPDSSMEKPWCFTHGASLDSGAVKEACAIDECQTSDPDFFFKQAAELADVMKSTDKSCDCASHLYGDTASTRDTTIKFMQRQTRSGRTRDGRRCSCSR